MARLVRSRSSAELRQHWRAGSVAAGWAYPSDWDSPAVDAVCEALLSRTDVWPAAERLGRCRAAAGVPLAETLADIDVLAALAPDCGDALRRAVSLGWADGSAAPTDAVVDPLTGLVRVDYLRVRLGEVYRAAEVEGSSAGATHALVVIRLGRAGARGLAQDLPMILAGDVLRTVFAGGQSLSRVGPTVAVALTGRTDLLGRQVGLLAELLAARIHVGPDPRMLPQVWIEHLPPRWDAAVDLLDELAR